MTSVRTATLSPARAALLAMIASALLVVGALVVTTKANAQQAYLSHRTNLRAGPDHGYPPVAWINSGATVYVNGCVNGYRWCDVSIDGLRGWANARHIYYPYQSRRVVLYGNGLAFGAPVVGFTVGSYWDSYYRDRPWYHHHGYWSGWRPGVAVRPEYYRAQPVYVAPRPVYVAPRPVYVHPHRADTYVHRPHVDHRHHQRNEAPRVRQERYEPGHNDRRSAPPAVMGFTR
jgi:uncharacterized protein YraI